MNRILYIGLLLALMATSLMGQANYGLQLADSAYTLTKQRVVYDPNYYRLDYPNGDVPSDRGVCTDVVIRAYRMMGTDLQKEVHEDMEANFSLYPNRWGLSSTDKNIDHRRVPNLMKYFERLGMVKEISDDAEDYLPGDIVCWDLGSGITHIGIVSSNRFRNSTRYMIIHNIGAGQVEEDMLFDYTIIGHYSYQE